MKEISVVVAADVVNVFLVVGSVGSKHRDDL